ncbi:hypothetical protein AC579_8540 [Pseudocercospora musae]|uniref:Cytochrome P450 n=1 Tax=Pseudocercospora musae TaxID=113226 RepID=A0A139HCR8_9PEZI|nr:hypothetical protein AC579_8540 [Pseudocercospora musae]
MLSSLDITHSPRVLLKTSAGVCLAYVVISVILSYFSAQARWLRKQEWVGYRKEWLSDIRAGLRSVLGTRAMVMASYEKSKEGFLALPQYMSELTRMYTMNSDIMRNPFHLGVVKNQLTRKLPLITADVQAELALGFAQQWQLNDDHEWRTVPAFETCGSIISRGANRVFCGAELCGNEDFLKHIGHYIEGAVRTGSILNLFPQWMRPLAGPIIARRLMREPLHACRQMALPVIQDRVQKTLCSVRDQEVHNDALQWVIEGCIKCGDPRQLDADRILRRLLGINVVALHTTSITVVNALLDLYSSPHAAEYVEGLREECFRVLRSYGGEWRKEVVNELFRIDSAIKESMRLNAIFTVGAIREVTKKDGVDLGDGLRVPYGVRIAAPSVAIHRDQHFYANPYEYHAFRFSRSREQLDADKADVDKRSQGMVTTSESFLAFGAGRQACPGRFFASQEMKLMLAHIVMNYDVKLPGPRPKNYDFKHASVPDPRSQLMIRRRTPQATI